MLETNARLTSTFGTAKRSLEGRVPKHGPSSRKQTNIHSHHTHRACPYTETRQRQGGTRKDEGRVRKGKDVPFSCINCVAFGGGHDLGSSAERIAPLSGVCASNEYVIFAHQRSESLMSFQKCGVAESPPARAGVILFVVKTGRSN